MGFQVIAGAVRGKYLPWMRNAALIIHIAIAITTINRFLFQIAMLEISIRARLRRLGCQGVLMRTNVRRTINSEEADTDE